MKLKELQIRVEEVKLALNEIPGSADESHIEKYLLDRIFWLERKIEELQDEHI